MNWVNYLKGRRTPQQALQNSDKALNAFKKVVISLETTNNLIDTEIELGVDRTVQLMEQVTVVTKISEEFKDIKEANVTRIEKINEFLNL